MGIFIYVLVMSVILFSAMGIDKRRARRQKRRIRERTLFILAFLGGAIGGVIGMRCFHHKTLHGAFRFGFPVLMVVQVAILCCGGYWLW